MRKLTLLLAIPFLALTSLSSCIAVAGVGAGALVANDYLSDTPHVAHIPIDVEQLWPATVENLTAMGGTELKIQNYPRLVEGKLYGGQVFVKVEAYDIDHSVLRMQFRKSGLIDNSTAESILSELINRYDFKNS